MSGQERAGFGSAVLSDGSELVIGRYGWAETEESAARRGHRLSLHPHLKEEAWEAWARHVGAECAACGRAGHLARDCERPVEETSA